MGRPHCVLVALDFSPCSWVALRYALFLTKRLGPTLDILHVLEAPPVFNNDGFELIRSDGESYGMRRNKAKRAISKLLSKENGIHDLNIKIRVECGTPGPVIVRVAEQGYDLIVIGKYGRNGDFGSGRGKTTRYVEQHAPCAVAPVWEPEPTLTARISQAFNSPAAMDRC